MVLVTALVGPNLALFLMISGLLAVYVEFLRPGWIVPGVVGASAALIGINILNAQPFGGAALLIALLGLVLLILEVPRPASFILTAAGTLVMFLAASLLVNPLSAAMIVPFALISRYLFAIAARARGNKRLQPIS